MGKKRNRRLRSACERQEYYRLAKAMTGDETNPIDDKLTLNGSDETSYSNSPISDIVHDVAPMSTKAWLIKHSKGIISTIVLAIISAALILFVEFVSNMRGDILFAEKSITVLETRVEGFSSDLVTKDLLEVKLSLIKAEICNAFPDIDTLEKRIDEIETILDSNNQS